MKSVFDKPTRDELIHRINSLTHTDHHLRQFNQ